MLTIIGEKIYFDKRGLARGRCTVEGHYAKASEFSCGIRACLPQAGLPAGIGEVEVKL